MTDYRELQRATAHFIAEKIESAANDLAGQARDFKNHPSLVGFGRLVGAFASLTTIVKGYEKPLRKLLGKVSK